MPFNNHLHIYLTCYTDTDMHTYKQAHRYTKSCMHTLSDFATMSTEVIKASDGATLQKIRVSWTYSQTYVCSDNMYLLTASTTVQPRREGSTFIRSNYYFTLRDNQLEILNPVCNARYSLTVTISLR